MKKHVDAREEHEKIVSVNGAADLPGVKKVRPLAGGGVS